jgi:hypothetical protein
MNAGKQPIAVTEILVADKWRTVGWIRKRSIPELSTVVRDLWEEDDGTTTGAPPKRWIVRPVVNTLQPGDVITVARLIEERRPDDLHSVRPYTTDVLGRMCWGREVSADEQRRAIESNLKARAYYG